jgi:thiazole synthase ThiGH ThiG subunit
MQGSILTLVPLLLDLGLGGQVLALLPLDVGTDSLVVDKVTAVADLLLPCELAQLTMIQWLTW